MLEEDGDQFHRKPGQVSVDEDEADRFFVMFIYLLMLSLTFFACCCICCVCLRKCKDAINLRLLPENLNLLTPTPREQETRARAGCCSLPQVNQAFVGLQHQSQGNHIEQPHHLRGTTMQSDYVTKLNPSSLFSFGNHSKNVPAQAVKYNSPTLATIIESKHSNDSSPSGSEIPPKVPKTSPPSSESVLQYHSDKTLNTTVNTSNLPDAVSSTFHTPPPSYCYPHHLQSVVRPCCSKSPLPFQIRSDFHPNLDQPDSYMTGLLPGPRRPHTENFQRFLNSQIHQTLDLPEINPQPFQRTSVAQEQQPNQSHPTSSELAGNIQTPETTQLFSQEEKKELPENSQTAQSSKMVNETQSINEPEIPQSTSEASVENFELSASLNSGYGDSSLFPLGTSRLQHYRSYNISPNDINSNDSDSIDRRRYCTHCHLCTLKCECSSSDENGNPKPPKNK